MKLLLVCLLFLFSASFTWAADTGGQRQLISPTPATQPQGILPTSAIPPAPSRSDSTLTQSPLQVFFQGVLDWVYGSGSSPEPVSTSQGPDHLYPMPPQTFK
jgi:hypothetical protein